MRREFLTFPSLLQTGMLLLLTFASVLSACVQPPKESSKASGVHSTGVDLNSATVEDLSALPGIGPATAEKIIAHRETFGEFEKPEHILLVRGISEKKFRKIRHLVVARKQPR
ncbi:MAG: helix-hairpin-helix domain-containing protein [Acidobacteria bacterium]|nr:MAG: helix-hairpin-helix domain-containing protein [Acidobacteriota bacterium]REK02660.1 MAG: helix-hairpin-helix domain-containing protein [Acidobacteriota bacterium]REK13536.1 MAG: helix-hairpin-helix domain-containing protein [Acidobacteriota bacterium]REK41530.1 MAG: helix-hairpin-helix domain-containing protein [Acidobacteriota bacterium]